MTTRHDARRCLAAAVLALVMAFLSAARGNIQPPAADSVADKAPPASLAASIAASLGLRHPP